MYHLFQYILYFFRQHFRQKFIIHIKEGNWSVIAKYIKGFYLLFYYRYYTLFLCGGHFWTLDNAALIVPSFIWSKVICLLCALLPTFLDGFLSNVVWRYVLVQSTHLKCLVMLLPVFRLLYGQRSYFGGCLLCALTATFLDRFLSNFLQRCIIL